MRLEVVGAPMDDFFPGVFVLCIGSELKPPRGESGLLDWRLAAPDLILGISAFLSI